MPAVLAWVVIGLFVGGFMHVVVERGNSLGGVVTSMMVAELGAFMGGFAALTFRRYGFDRPDLPVLLMVMAGSVVFYGIWRVCAWWYRSSRPIDESWV